MKDKEKFPENIQLSVTFTDSLQKAVERLGEKMTDSLQTALMQYRQAGRETENAKFPVYSQKLVYLTSLLDAVVPRTDGDRTVKEKWTMEVPGLVTGSALPVGRAFHMGYGKTASSNRQIQVSLEDYSAGNIAGHEATLGVLRQILSVVSNISISDEAITGAVQRRQEKMAVVKGGQW